MATLHFEKIPPKNGLTKDSPLLIMLHGRGADEKDLLMLGPILNDNFFTISIRASKKYRYGGFAWFELSDDLMNNENELSESLNSLNETIDSIINNFIFDHKKIFLLGFSQGAMMAYAVGLTRPEIFTGIIAQSGYVINQKIFNYKWNESSKINFLHTHGELDMVVPFSKATETKNLFEKNKTPLEFKSYRMGHEISEECLRDVQIWINNLI